LPRRSGNLMENRIVSRAAALSVSVAKQLSSNRVKE